MNYPHRISPRIPPRIPHGTARDALVSAAKRLLWERGYEAMSPKAVLSVSGAGQGSFYHHFTGKAHLAATALNEIATRLIDGLECQLDPRLPPLEQIERYLTAPRDGLKGCRLGRLANERSVLEEPALRQAMEPYFTRLEDILAELLQNAIGLGDLSHDTNPTDLAATLAAVVQGGYSLSRIRNDPDQLARATRGALSLLTEAAKP